MSSRHYIFPTDDEPLRLSSRLVEGMIFGKGALPPYAGTRQKVVSVVLELDGANPQHIPGATGAYWVSDTIGDIRKGIVRSAGDMVSAAAFDRWRRSGLC